MTNNMVLTARQKALQIKPDFSLAHYNLGKALQDKGDLNSAINSYQNAISIK